MATFAEQFAKIATGYDGPEVNDEPESDNRWCELCHQLGIVNKNGYCSQCQEDVDRGYTINAKAGRCVNGAEADSGTLFHIRMLGENGPDRIPLCGKPPGRRSAGWSTWRPVGQQATCPKCLKRLRAQQQEADESYVCSECGHPKWHHAPGCEQPQQQGA